MRTLIIILFLLPACLCAQKYTISGYVRDASTGENLIGATIYDLKSKSGSVTNIYGFFSLTLPSDSVRLRASFVGYQVKERSFYLKADEILDFSLEAGKLLDEVVVTAEEAIELLPQMSTVTVPMEQLKQVPVLLGETDIMKTIQLLPGIQGGNEGTSGVYVRGGGPDQNLILIDGVPVYNANHLFGFFSVFNADAINNVSVVKGGFPARYGGRLSSVIDISMKEGNNQKISGKGSIGLISSKFTIEGPIKNENTSFILSARRTYIDLLARPIIKSSSGGDVTFGYFFEDFNAKINHRFSRRDRLYLSFYGGKDKAYFREKYESSFGGLDSETTEDEAGLRWGNLISAVRWNHLYSPKLFSNVTATFSRYRFDVFSNYKVTRAVGDSEEERIRYLSGIEDMALKVDFDYLPSADHNIKFGASVINHAFRPGVFSYRSEVEADTTFGARSIRANELAAYLEDDFQIGNKLRFNVGLHGSMFEVRGETFLSLQPRLSARYLLGQDISLKASYAEMRQFVHLLSNSGIGLPTDLWVPATDLVKPQESWQAAVGVAKSINGFEISLESYYKEMDNLIEYLDGASFFNTDDEWEDKVAAGSGTSYGTEFLIQKKTGRLTGWVGYTWSKTTRQFDDLNFGKSYPYKYDRRHDLSVVSVYRINDRISISGTWVYGTGNAISLPESQFRDFNPNSNSFFTQSLEYYGSRNNYRMRDYHRLDLGISMSKQKKRGMRTWSFGAYNLYSRRNPFYIDIRSNNTGREFVQTSLFPVIPYFTYSFEF